MNRLILIVVIALGLCSCEKEEHWTSNWQIPIDLNNPKGIAGGGSISYILGTPDSILVQRIIEGQNLTSEEIKFLSLTPYAYNGRGTHEIINPNPKYMRFPHSIMSTSDNWNWEHLCEYCELGEEEFCNIYFNGERTLGMTWGEPSCNYCN